MHRTRLLFIFSFLFASVVAFGQQYRVCSVSSAPASVSRSNKEAVVRNIILESKEVLKFSKFSKISLMETKSKEIFVFSGEGEFSVADLVGKNRKKLSANQKAHVKDLLNGNEHTKLAGVVYKDAEAPVHFLQEGSLQIVDQRCAAVDPKDIDAEGIYYFAVSNTSDIPYFVNVIKTDSQGNRTACCDSKDPMAQLGLLVPEGGTVVLTDFPQLGNQLLSSTFRVAASEYTFDARDFIEKSPHIQLLSHSDNSVVTYPEITLGFLVRKSDKVKSLYLLLNGEDTGVKGTVTDGRNEVKVKLANMGANTIELGVADIYGNTHYKKISVNYQRINKPKLHIMSVGIGNYKDKKIEKLHFAASDAAMVYKVLDTLRDMNLHLYEKGGFRRLLVEEQATRANILKGLDDLKIGADPEDIVMVYMSGHGKNVEFKGKRYFLPYDVEDNQYIESTAISYADLKSKFRELEDKECKVVVYMDACYAGEMYYAKAAGEFIGDSEPAVIGFYSSTKRQPSLEKVELEHGIFTYALLNGIKGGASDSNGNVTISSLGDYITEQVRIESGGQQNPKVDNGGEDFILFKAGDAGFKVSAPVISKKVDVAEPSVGGGNDAVVELARKYYTGEAFAPTTDDECKVYLQAAAAGDANSMFMAGVCLETGRGCSPDYKAALKWYEQAAYKGLPVAQYNLGVMHYNGMGTPKSDENAQKWFNEAAIKGYSKAITALGCLYYFKESPEYGKAFEYFSKSAQDGDAMALYYMGECYLYGNGTEENLPAAMDAFKKSAEKGYKGAVEVMKLVEIDY